MSQTRKDLTGIKIYQTKKEIAEINKIQLTNFTLKITNFNIHYLYYQNPSDIYYLKKIDQKINIIIPLKLKYKKKTLFNKHIKFGEIPIPNKKGNFIINGNDRTIIMKNTIIQK